VIHFINCYFLFPSTDFECDEAVRIVEDYNFAPLTVEDGEVVVIMETTLAVGRLGNLLPCFGKTLHAIVTIHYVCRAA
jgi:hypothetical protein